MAGVETADTQVPPQSGSRNSTWHYQPPVPVSEVPGFVWPFKPMALLRYLFSWGYVGSVVIPFGLLATLTWFYLQPALERCKTFELDWIAQMFGRNLLLLVVVVTALHLYLHTFKRQGDEKKFDTRPLGKNDPKFLGRNQVLDNVFWTCISGVPIWTAYEVFYMWGYANDLLPVFMDWREHPIWFVALFLIIPFWSALHFYFVHRLLHWRPLYRIAHAVHHRNVALCPWSGFSMHPIEHVLYLSTVLVHLVVLSHPLHVIFHCQWQAIGANTSHAGFEAITFRGKPVLYLTSYFHQMHHRYYDCNYGNPLMLWDKWLGSYHDGTPESWEEIKKQRREKLVRDTH